MRKMKRKEKYRQVEKQWYNNEAKGCREERAIKERRDRLQVCMEGGGINRKTCAVP